MPTFVGKGDFEVDYHRRRTLSRKRDSASKQAVVFQNQLRFDDTAYAISNGPFLRPSVTPNAAVAARFADICRTNKAHPWQELPG